MSRPFVFFLFITLVALFVSSPAEAAPKIEVSPGSWEFGAVYQWDNPSTEITIRNAGDQPLVIERVKASCGFTAELLTGKTIEPGNAGKLKINFNSFGTNPGPIRRDIMLLTNDPSSRKTLIMLNGRVRSEKSAVASIEPDYLDLGVVAPYETRLFTISLTNTGNTKLDIESVELPEGFYLESAEPSALPAMGLVVVKVGFRPPIQQGPINDEIVFKASNPVPQQIELRARIVGYIAESARGSDSLIITPSVIKVSGGSPKPAAEVSLKNEGQGRVLVEDAESPLQAEETGVTGRELKPGESGRLSVGLAPDGLAPGTKGYLYIRVAIPIEVESAVKK
jgi:hypothetical protein